MLKRRVHGCLLVFLAHHLIPLHALGGWPYVIHHHRRAGVPPTSWVYDSGLGLVCMLWLRFYISCSKTVILMVSASFPQWLSVDEAFWRASIAPERVLTMWPLSFLKAFLASHRRRQLMISKIGSLRWLPDCPPFGALGNAHLQTVSEEHQCGTGLHHSDDQVNILEYCFNYVVSPFLLNVPPFIPGPP